MCTQAKSILQHLEVRHGVDDAGDGATSIRSQPAPVQSIPHKELVGGRYRRNSGDCCVSLQCRSQLGGTGRPKLDERDADYQKCSVEMHLMLVGEVLLAR